MEQTIPTKDFFWRWVKKGSDCWLWTGSLCKGYGVITRDGKHMAAHRVAYMEKFGPIPEGTELDHLCRVRCCVNPSHLEVVTHSQNVKRGTAWHHVVEKAKKQTHCIQGHLFDEKNTKLFRGKNGNIWRGCRACNSLAGKSYYYRVGKLKRQQRREQWKSLAHI